MPDGRHHDPHIEGKLVGAALLEEVPFEEHAGPFTELNDGACHAFVSESKMRRGVERDGVEVSDVTNLVHALGAGVLTGHDIAAQVDDEVVRAVHATFLAEGLDGPPALDRGIEFVDALAKAKGGPVAVWCRSFEHVMCSKGDEPWAQAERMNFARMRCGSR